MPCQGVFADVQRLRKMSSIEDIKEMKNILHEYEEYKNGLNVNNFGDYHQVIAGKMFLNADDESI